MFSNCPSSACVTIIIAVFQFLHENTRPFDDEMKTRSVTYCFFVFYLVLFWNLGPSFHRLDCLDFHGSDAITCVGQAGSCCCQHSTSPGDQDSDDVPDDGAIVRKDCSCLFCEYFDDFNPVVDSVSSIEDSSPFTPCEFWTQTFSNTAAVAATARGPPLV